MDRDFKQAAEMNPTDTIIITETVERKRRTVNVSTQNGITEKRSCRVVCGFRMERGEKLVSLLRSIVEERFLSYTHPQVFKKYFMFKLMMEIDRKS